ncbi:MAG: acyl-CoA thioesterase [Chitinophagales bacterium]|nr:acyl-CoA thioesterase [Chitinophagales bacterium]
MKSRIPSESLNIHTELIMPGHTNPLGNLMGGNLLSWMDVACGVSAIKHCGTICVTASVDNVSFRLPIKVGDVVVLKSFATRAFNTSLEVCCEVYIYEPKSRTETLSHTAYFTFVSLDENGKGTQVPQLEPITDIEKVLYDSAERRREVRLFLAGKIKGSETKYLKAMLEE